MDRVYLIISEDNDYDTNRHVVGVYHDEKQAEDEARHIQAQYTTGNYKICLISVEEHYIN